MQKSFYCYKQKFARRGKLDGLDFYARLNQIWFQIVLRITLMEVCVIIASIILINFFIFA